MKSATVDVLLIKLHSLLKVEIRGIRNSECLLTAAKSCIIHRNGKICTRT